MVCRNLFQNRKFFTQNVPEWKHTSVWQNPVLIYVNSWTWRVERMHIIFFCSKALPKSRSTFLLSMNRFQLICINESLTSLYIVCRRSRTNGRSCQGMVLNEFLFVGNDLHMYKIQNTVRLRCGNVKNDIMQKTKIERGRVGKIE